MENNQDEGGARKCHAKTIMSTGKGFEAQRWTHIMCHLGRACREKYVGRGEKEEAAHDVYDDVCDILELKMSD